MSSDKSVADRLLDDARAKTAREAQPKLGKVALIVGVVALLASPISIAGWVLGASALILGLIAARNPETAKPAKIAMVLGAAAVFVGIFFFTLALTR